MPLHGYSVELDDHRTWRGRASESSDTEQMVEDGIPIVLLNSLLNTFDETGHYGIKLVPDEPSKRTFRMVAESEQEQADWISAIDRRIREIKSAKHS